jgi:hypothetical protein
MLGFEIGPTISCLLLAIVVVDVRHLLPNSCHFAFANFIGLINHCADECEFTPKSSRSRISACTSSS